MLLSKLNKKIKKIIIDIIIQKNRVRFYSYISTIKIDTKKKQPVLVNGKGTVKIFNNVNFGVKQSKDYYSKYSYLDVRKEKSYIEIGENTQINNNLTIISDGKNIIIGKNCLIGTDVEILDSNFHDLDPNSRFGGKNILKGDIIIEDNVFIGNRVTILKNVKIGKNSVIGTNSVVIKDIPDNCIAAGNPAKVIKSLLIL